MKAERKKDIKKLMKRYGNETMFMSSTHMMYENRHFKKLEKIISKNERKEFLFKTIKSQLNKNIFLFKLLELITGQATILEEKDRGRMNKIFDFWKNYQFK